MLPHEKVIIPYLGASQFVATLIEIRQWVNESKILVVRLNQLGTMVLVCKVC